MALILKRLADIQQLGSSAGTVFANPSGKKSVVRCISLHNTNTTTETIELWRVPDNAGAVGTAADANRIHKLALPANESVSLEHPGMILEDQNDTIQSKSTTAAKVTVSIDGGQE